MDRLWRIPSRNNKVGSYITLTFVMLTKFMTDLTYCM